MDQIFPLLRAKHLSKTFLGKERSFHALHQIHLDIFPGEIFGIIGPSGAGKSTLLRCLSTLEQPTEGEVFFEGIKISQLSNQALRPIRRDIGMVFQNFQLLFSKTVEENIAFPLEIHAFDREKIAKRVDELLEWVSLSDKKKAYPSELSGGQKQRVGIARALATNPKLLFCDEATSALDAGATKQILDLLRGLQKQLRLTIVLITHEMDVIRQICDRVAVLSHGQIIESAPVVDLFCSPQHAVTKSLLQTSHHLPPKYSPPSPTKKTVRLSFRGKSSQEPVISMMIRTCNVDANIQSGWLDAIQEETIGTLIIELSGMEENLEKAFLFLSSKGIAVELLGSL
jgi:D-methionine transport system ATP-binding protein